MSYWYMTGRKPDDQDRELIKRLWPNKEEEDKKKAEAAKQALKMDDAPKEPKNEEEEKNVEPS